MTSTRNFSPPPGPLREAHAHIGAHGRAMGMLNLGACTSRGALLERVAQAARRTVARDWLLGVCVRPQAWEDPTWPTRDELDAVAGDTPCCLLSFDYHAVAVSSAALYAAGFDDASPDPAGGVICRDASGRPNGHLLERAAKIAWEAAPEPTAAQWREHVKRALADLAAHGFTQVHDLLSQDWLGPILAELDDADELPVEVWVYPPMDRLEAVHAGARVWQRDRVRLAGGKCFADGTLNSKTAWTLHPFADPLPDHPRGVALLSPDDLDRAISRTRDLGVGLAVHAIGDGAVRAVLDAWERSRGPAWRGTGVPPLRIEHCELIDSADVARFAALGVVCSVQPCHLLADIEVLRREFPGRLHRVLPLRELIGAGCTPGELLWFGSDVPIVRPHPADSVQAAVCRRREGAPAEEALGMSQAVSEAESWRAFRPARGIAG
jgi:predicted amidohydrolase YtcJ